MSTLTEGTWKVSHTEVERTAHGPFNRKVTRTIIVKCKRYDDGHEVWRQTEYTHWNGVQVHDGTYPADTEYAAMRRAGIAPF